MTLAGKELSRKKEREFQVKNIAIVLVFVSSLVAGCGDFGGYPQVGAPVTGDAGPAVFGDAGPTPPAVDAGTVPQVDSGTTPTPTVDSGTVPVPPVLGAPCDQDTDTYIGSCTLSWCSEAYMVCAGSTWGCFAAGFDCHEPTPEVDAGHEEPDAGTDAGPACLDGALLRCDRDCGGSVHVSGVSICLDGAYGTCRAIPGIDCPATGTDAGVVDAGTDAGSPSVDAGVDAYVPTPAVDAGHSVAMRTLSFDFNVDAVLLYSPSSMDFLEETALSGATHADARPVTCESGSGVVTVGGATWFRCILTRAVGTEFFFVGTFMTHASSTYGSSEAGVWASFSGWNPGGGSCGDLAATRGVAWAITETSGRSLLPASGIPEIVQPRGITEDGRRVCRGRMVF